MTAFNFGDSYRAAGLTLGPDVLATRVQPFEKLRGSINPQQAIDLVRLYYALPVPGGTLWFRDAFGEKDTSFSLIENAREAAVLAAGLIEAAVVDGKLYAALATLTTGACGLRKPLVRPELIDVTRHAIVSQAASNRRRTPVDVKQITSPAVSKVSADLAALIQAPELVKACAVLKQVSEESHEITETLASQVYSVVHSLAPQVLALCEEVEMLWWHVGGWSRLLDKPFAELDLGLAAVLAGIDMADMSESVSGPAAAAAIFQRTLSVGRQIGTAKIAVKDVVDALPENAFDRLRLTDKLGAVPEICPVLTAFAKAKEIGAGSAWHASFTKASALEASSSFSPLELAMQVYRERLLLRALG